MPCYWFAAGTDFSLRDLGFGEGLPTHVATYRADLGLQHRDYSVSVGSDADTETDGIMSPEHAVRLWGRSNTKSGRSSCLSSRANSNLTLTDTEHENTENGRNLSLSLLVLLPCGHLALLLENVWMWFKRLVLRQFFFFFLHFILYFDFKFYMTWQFYMVILNTFRCLVGRDVLHQVEKEKINVFHNFFF